MRKKSEKNKKGITLIILFTALLLVGLVLVRMYNSDTHDYEIDADGFLLIKTADAEGKGTIQIPDQSTVEKIEKELSGKYKLGETLVALNSDVVQMEYMLTPVHKGNAGEVEEAPDESLLTKEGLQNPNMAYDYTVYILDEKNIAIPTGDGGSCIKAKKRGDPIDLSVFEGIYKSAASAEEQSKSDPVQEEETPEDIDANAIPEDERF